LRLRRPQGVASPPDWQQVEKGHGRVELRRLWLERCDADMQAYLQQQVGWPGVQWCGWLHRQRRSAGRQEESLHLWVAGAQFVWLLSPQQAASYLREHWGIENGVCYVRDVTMDEDRLSGRKIGYSLSGIRNVALNLLRRLEVRYLPDARRRIAAMPDAGVHLLFN
jgi:hypothetical protein